MILSFSGLEKLKAREGLRLYAYKDSVRKPTIGYGTIKINGKPVEMGMTCTEEQASVWLQADVAWASTAVNKLVKSKLSQNQFDALVSFVYNVGESAFAKSTMLKMLNMGMFKEASKEFTRWTYAGGKIVQGLLNRRLSEQEQFNT